MEFWTEKASQYQMWLSDNRKVKGGRIRDCRGNEEYMKKMSIRRISFMLCACVVCASLLTGCGTGNGSADRMGEGGPGVAEGADAKQSGSGSIQNLSSTTGRYMEKEVELPEGLGSFGGLSMEGDRIRLFSEYGLDFISDNRGYDFEQDTQIPAAFQNRMESDYYMGMAVTPKGHRLFTVYEISGDEAENGTYTTWLMQPDGEEKELTELPTDCLTANLIYGQNGYFYLSSGNGQEENIYQVDPETGEVLFLFAADELPGILTVAGNRLYAGLERRLLAFNLESKELVEDPVLEEFLRANLTNYSFQETLPFLLCQGTDDASIYVAVRDGLYRHVIGGSVMEQVIDGNLCSIGDISKPYVGMIAVAEDGREVFYILYLNGKLMRYTYDDSQPTVPETILRVYSLYNSENIRMAVSAFQAENPMLYVKYEVGVVEESGQTREDALKALSTELAAGRGPDVLVMDNLPYDSYVKKGVLADLSATASGIGKSGLFENILEPFRADGKLYSIPMVFSVPVICGTSGSLQDVGTLDQLAELLEAARDQKKDGGLIGFYNAKNLLELLSMASSNAWIRGNGSLNHDSLTEFLTQCKKIYDIEMSGMGLEDGEMETDLDGAAENPAIRKSLNRINNMLNYAVYMQKPFSGGSLSGTPDDLAMMLAYLTKYGMDYSLMPGQNGKSFHPSCMLSLNSAGMYRDQAEAFVKFALSEDFQGKAGLDSAPVNRDAFSAKQAFPYVDGSPEEPYLLLSSTDDKGNVQELDVRWPKKEDFDAFTLLVESLDTCNTGTDVVRDAVLEFGPEALTGEIEIGEAVESIEKRVRLYLAE